LASRIRRVLTFLTAVIAGSVAIVAVLYFVFGLRLVRQGSGMPWPMFTRAGVDHDAELERHRASQGAQSPAAAVAVTPTQPDPSQPASAASGSATPAATPAAASTSATVPSSTSSASSATSAAAPGNGPPAAAQTPQTGAAQTGTAEAPAAPAAAARSASAGSWTDFRGPQRDGRYRQGPIATTWPSGGLQPVWKQPIGVGFASFVAAEGRLFTIEQRRDREVVASYDAETGRELWTHGWQAGYRDHTGDGPRATPTWHGGRIYALGAEGDLRVLDAQAGKLIWQKNILADNGAQNLSWGMAASPLIVDDKVIVLPGGRGGKSVVAYHKDTGARVWSVLDDRQAYTAPMVVTLGGKRQLIVVSAERAVGLTVEEGRLLWESPWVTDYGVNASQPIVIGDNRLFLSAGYGHGASVIELTPTGETFSVRTVWENTRMKNKFTSSVLHEGHIYGLDEAILACMDAATGELKWKGGRYGYGQLVLANGHLIVAAENGDLALVKASPASHQEVARFPAIEGKTWNHPAIADGRLFVRNGEEMAAFDLRPR
jgi:outer membrane protein assembly factor BamB